MSDEAVLVNKDQGVGLITLNRPDKFNCLSISVHQAIKKAVVDFETDSNIRSVLIVAEGKNFCTGADLEEFNAIRFNEKKLNGFIQTGLDNLASLEASPLPVVSAIQGLCLAGGLELMMATDIVFAADNARLGDQHAHFGLLPGWGGSQRLPRLVGKRVAMDLLYSARWLSAPQAKEVGLVNYVVAAEQLKESALEYCYQLNQKSAHGIATMKKMVNEGLDKELDEAIAMESDYAISSFQSGDVNEGLTAFQEKRRPNFARRN